MTRQIRVLEGNTGILYLTDETGKVERYVPDYDLDKARELLLEFQELKDANGRRLKENYHAEGYNWYPAMVSFLYWYVFFQYVKYRPLAEKVIDGSVEFEFENRGNFRQLVSLLKYHPAMKGWKIRLFYFLVDVNNTMVVRKYPSRILFFRFAMDDFRSSEIRKALDELQVEYIQVVPPPRMKDVAKNLFRRGPYYFFGGISRKSRFRCKYNLDNIGEYESFLFQRAIEKAETSISGYIVEYDKHLRRLKSTQIRTFYGFDDCNGYVFPILYACQQNGIRTVGHQHGAYVKRHAGYVMEGINRKDYKWFDKIIVWGDYWKEHLLRISNVYSPDMLVVGSNKLSWNYSPSKANHSKPTGILVPYEFASNSYKIGKFISKFLDLGYDVWFKPRSDEKLEDQLEAYCLSKEYLTKMRIVEKIDSAFMEKIDIVAGTMTTLVYELLPYNKIVWILDIEYKHLEDLVEGNYAYKVRYEDLGTLDESYFTRTEVNADYFFSKESLKDTLLKHVLDH